MASRPLDKCITLKEHIMWFIEDGTIILDLDDVVETNHTSYPTKGLPLIQFGSLQPTVLYKHGFPSPTMQGGFFPVSVFDKITVNMASCSEVKEKTNEKDGR